MSSPSPTAATPLSSKLFDWEAPVARADFEAFKEVAAEKKAKQASLKAK